MLVLSLTIVEHNAKGALHLPLELPVQVARHGAKHMAVSQLHHGNHSANGVIIASLETHIRHGYGHLSIVSAFCLRARPDLVGRQ